MEKTDKDKGISNPSRLIDFAEEQKQQNNNFFAETDKMVVVFDTDIYKDNQEEYKKVLEKARHNEDIIAVTYPSFELFLLLHIKDANKLFLKKEEEKILKNKDDGGSKNKTYIYKLCNKKYGFNVKSSTKTKSISENIKIAIKEEKYINKDIDEAIGKLTSNIGDVLNKIFNDEL